MADTRHAWHRNRADGDICPDSDEERIYSIAVMLVGCGVYGYIVGSIVAIVSASDAERRKTNEKLDEIQAYTEHRKIPTDLRRRIRRHYQAFFNMKSSLDEAAILSDLSPSLRVELGAFLIQEAVFGNEVLAEVPDMLLDKLVVCLKVGARA